MPIKDWQKYVKLKEWQKHVTNCQTNKSYCGEGDRDTDFMFLSTEHALEAIDRGSRLMPCPACVNKITSILKGK